jgi:hypothetical protein
MIKFDKAVKTGVSGFDRFKTRSKKRQKLEALKTKECLKHGKGKERYQGANPCVNDQIWHSGKIGVSCLSKQNIQFLQR